MPDVTLTNKQIIEEWEKHARSLSARLRVSVAKIEKLERQQYKNRLSLKTLRQQYKKLEQDLANKKEQARILASTKGDLAAITAHRDRIAANLEPPMPCPICDTQLKRYPKRITGAMAMALVYLVKHYDMYGEAAWVHVVKEEKYKKFIRAAAYGQLVYWGLVESRANTDPAIKTSGVWRATQKGVKFVHREIRVPEVAWVFLGEVQDYSEEQGYIFDVFKQSFHYEEMMDEAYDGWRKVMGVI